MTVRVSARARREAERRDTWWRANRVEATDLFTRELIEAIRMLEQNPDLGQRYEAVRFETQVRRFLLPGTKTHVYHARIAGQVVILAVWGARRGRAPRL